MPACHPSAGGLVARAFKGRLPESTSSQKASRADKQLSGGSALYQCCYGLSYSTMWALCPRKYAVEAVERWPPQEALRDVGLTG